MFAKGNGGLPFVNVERERTHTHTQICTCFSYKIPHKTQSAALSWSLFTNALLQPLCHYAPAASHIKLSVCVRVEREMEAQLDRARESQRQQIQQADAALEQLKKQVELSSERTYSEMKHQACCVNTHTHTQSTTHTVYVDMQGHPPVPLSCLTHAQRLLITISFLILPFYCVFFIDQHTCTFNFFHICCATKAAARCRTGQRKWPWLSCGPAGSPPRLPYWAGERKS